MQEYDNGWHLDKRVPIAIIIALVVQLTVFTWYISARNTEIDNSINIVDVKVATEVNKLNERLAHAHERIFDVEVEIGKLPKTFPPTKIVQQLTVLKSELDHIKNSVDQILDKINLIPRYDSDGGVKPLDFEYEE